MSEPRFSILIPTWNNLPFLKLCIESIQKHSTYSHEIIIHINEGNDGTEAWVKEQKTPFTQTFQNSGVCVALNMAAQLATTDYICFFNDDMYALPEWDKFLWEEIQSIGHDQFFLSATMIEPTDTGNSCVIAPNDFGRNIEDFREKELLEKYAELKKEDWCGATWPPNVVHKKWWDKVGGYSVEFSPGISSDPDFSMKLWKEGIRIFKGLSKSRVYHFQAKTTGKVTRNDGPKTFLNKWGITQGLFSRYYLQRGKAWNGPLNDPKNTPGFMIQKLRAKLKKAFL